MSRSARANERTPLAPDEAKAACAGLFAAFQSRSRKGYANEATTRAELIDEILKVLGWQHSDIAREDPSGTGKFLDYLLSANEEPWIVLEAKRADSPFTLKAPPRRGVAGGMRPVRSLPARGGDALDEVLGQAATYCCDRGVPLAVASNGEQWIFFRGLSAPGRPWREGNALVFASADEVLNGFDEFYLCLARATAGRPYLPERLELPSSSALPAGAKPIDLLTNFQGGRKQVPINAAALKAIGSHFFGSIHQNDGTAEPDRLKHCYVSPAATGNLDESLARLLHDACAVASDEKAVLESGTPEEFASVVEADHGYQNITEPIIVVGNIGAGKTTFIYRALEALRKGDCGAFVTVIDLEGAATVEGPAEQWPPDTICTRILEQLPRVVDSVIKGSTLPEKERGQIDPRSVLAARSMFRNELKREKENFELLHPCAQGGWGDREEAFLAKAFSDAPELCLRYLRFVANRFKSTEGINADKRRPVVVVLDNVDQEHDDFQRAAFHVARRLTSKGKAIVVLCLRETTYDEGRSPSGFLSGCALHNVYHVAAPHLDALLRQRVRFGRRILDEGKLPPKLRSDKDLCARVFNDLESLLAPKSDALAVLAGLSGSNMRKGLEFTNSVVGGAITLGLRPAPTAGFVFECLLAQRQVDRIDDAGLGIRNVFKAIRSDRPLHALATRLLGYLSWTNSLGSARTHHETEDIVAGRLGSLGYPAAAVSKALAELVSAELVHSATLGLEGGATRYRITAAGFVHLHVLLNVREYRVCMALLTDWFDSAAAREFVDCAAAAGGPNGPSFGDVAESAALGVFEAYLSRSVAAENRLLAISKAPNWWHEASSRAQFLLAAEPRLEAHAASREVTQPSRERQSRRLRHPEGQTRLPLGDSARSIAPLKCLKGHETFLGREWIPRILWALGHAKLNRSGPLSAADIARVLTRDGGMAVPGTNVARLFRQVKGDAAVSVLWTVSGRRYEITEAGWKTLVSVLEIEDVK